MSESVNEIIAALQKLPVSRKQQAFRWVPRRKDEAIRYLEELLAVGEKSQFGTTADVANFIHGVLQGKGAWWRYSEVGQFQIFPSGHSSGGSLYFGYKIDDDEFVWGLRLCKGRVTAKQVWSKREWQRGASLSMVSLPTPSVVRISGPRSRQY